MVTQKREVPASTGSGGGKFLKIEIGQSVKGVFRGEPQIYYRKWPKGGVKVESDVPAAGFDERYKVNFVTQEDGVFVAKIFDCNVYIYNQIADINESMDIETIKCKISRQSAGKGSTYMILPIIKEVISAKALAEIEAIELIPLGKQPPQPDTGDGDGF